MIILYNLDLKTKLKVEWLNVKRHNHIVGIHQNEKLTTVKCGPGCNPQKIKRTHLGSWSLRHIKYSIS